MDAQVSAQRRQLPSSNFHFPKWYTDYAGVNGLSTAEANSARGQIYRLTFLHRDGTHAQDEDSRSRHLRDSVSSQQHHQRNPKHQQQQFPALRPIRAQQPSSFHAASRGHRQPPLPTGVLPLGKASQQRLNLPGFGKYKSFVATSAGVTAHPALYSSIRAVHGGARQSVRQRAVETIPSVESIRQDFRLPPILVRKLA